VPREVQVIQHPGLEERKRGEAARKVRIPDTEGEPSEEHGENEEEKDHSPVDDGDEKIPSLGFRHCARILSGGLERFNVFGYHGPTRFSLHATMHARIPARLLAALIAVIPPFALSACLVPSTRPSKAEAAPAPEIPYEGISAAVALGRPDDALRSYEQALSSAPQSSATRVLHGRLLMIAGKLAEAREEFGLVLAEEPRNTDALYNLSLVAGLEGRAEEQEALLRQTVRIDGAHADALAALGQLALAARDTVSAQGFFDRALARDPANLAALLGSGNILLASKQWRQAEEVLSRAVAAQPDYPFCYVDRARARRALRDYPGAVQDLSRAISLDPRYPWSYIDRGRLYATQSRGPEARADFSMAIRLDPDQFEGYALRAQSLQDAGDREGALHDWEQVLRLRPDYGYAFLPLATLSWWKGDWPRARDAFIRAYGFQEDDPSLALCAALCAIRQGRPGDVSAILSPALQKIPVDSWYREVARFLLERSSEGQLLGRIDRERDTALKARMLFYVAITYLSTGMDRAGLVYLTQADGKGAPHRVETDLVRIELDRIASAPGQ
jgi:tetratricopeptide (TPR) repeat protein